MRTNLDPPPTGIGPLLDQRVVLLDEFDALAFSPVVRHGDTPCERADQNPCEHATYSSLWPGHDMTPQVSPEQLLLTAPPHVTSPSSTA